MRLRAPAFEALFAAIFFLAATVLFTWPIAWHVNDGLADLWDAKLNAWILHWDYHQTFHNPVRLFDANIYFPARFALAFSENLYGAAFFAFPLYTAGVSTLAAYNVLFLLGMLSSAFAAWALARYVTGDSLASLLAGIVYAFVPWRLAQISHIQFQWGAFLALSLLFVLRYFDRGTRRELVLFALFFAWNAATNVHYAIFSALLLGLVLAYEALARTGPDTGRRVRNSLGAALLAAVVVSPLYVPYAKVSRLYDMQRNESEIRFYSGRPIDFLTAGPQNKLYAPLTQKWSHPEGDFFPGLVPLVLAAVALTRARRATSGEKPHVSALRRGAARALDLVALAGLATWLLASFFSWPSIGPIQLRDPGRVLVLVAAVVALRLVLAFPAGSSFAHLRDLLRRMRLEPRAALFLFVGLMGIVVALGWHTPFYRFLVESLGSALRAIRVPSRGIVLFDLGLGVLASWGLSRLPRRSWLVPAALVLTAVEYRAFPLQVESVTPDPPPVARWLAEVKVPGGVVEWPLGNWYDQEHEFRSTAHWRPILNGASGFAPRAYRELETSFAKRPIPESVWGMLAEQRAALLIFHPAQVNEDAVKAYAEAVHLGLTQGRIALVRSFPDGDFRDFVFELASTPLGIPREGDPRRVETDLRMLDGLRHPPFGFLDSPTEWESVAPGTWGYGWALDDSGVVRVTATLEDGSTVPILIGLPHPGPPKVYPQYPDVDRSGFSFQIPSLASGAHRLTLTILAKDHGTERITRYFRVP